MNNFIKDIRAEIAPLREQLIKHPVYQQINSVRDLQLFMEYHVFAVWDFMSLLKSLQQKLTCTSVPWIPAEDAETCYLINEIVLGEETDIDENGQRMSHFELYLKAMQQSGANINNINGLLEKLKNREAVSAALSAVASEKVAEFVDFTFDIINTGEAYLQAAVFTFGREDLIPDMFLSLVNDLHKKFPQAINTFKYYLERHIEVDGDHHTPLALNMTNCLCGDDPEKWQKATAAVKKALEMRIQLWDAIAEKLTNNQLASAN